MTLFPVMRAPYIAAEIDKPPILTIEKALK
jgi:hypothetical protein